MGNAIKANAVEYGRVPNTKYQDEFMEGYHWFMYLESMLSIAGFMLIFVPLFWGA